MTTEESMKDEHLALAFECNRQLRAALERANSECDTAMDERIACGQRVAELEAENDALRKIESAARNLIAVKGRHHTEQAMRKLIAAMQPIPCTTAEQSKP